MTDDQRTNPCDEHSDNLAELALGILTGRERAATLAHVESCPRCAEELEQLAHAADAVVGMAPEVEPPVGFEVQLFSRMGLGEPPTSAEVRTMSRRPSVLARARGVPRWGLAAAAAVVALAIGLSIGWSIGSPSNGHTAVTQASNGEGERVASADLLEHGSAVGHVFTYGGSTPWMIVTLADSWSHGKVTCRVVTTNGVVHDVGSFTAEDGYGAWGAPLRVAPQDVQKAEVVSADGTVIATASLS